MTVGQPTRRAFLSAGAYVAATPALGGLTTSPVEMAEGTVFEDVHGTGARPRFAPGIAGVMVSNGRDVTLTAWDGSWQLPVRSGDSIFVVKPSGWRGRLGANGQPRLSYLYQPSGSSPGFASRFEGVSPTGPLPQSIDFALQRADESARFDALLVADTQPGSASELGYVRDALLSRVPASGAAFAIHHGDVMGDDLSLLDRYQGLIGATGVPWHHCPGNHDMNLDADPVFAFESWKRSFGMTHGAFQYGGATFIQLNNVVPLRAADAAEPGRPYKGEIGPRQLAFVESVLRHVPAEQLVVISMHIPLVNFEDPDNPADTTSDRARLLALLSGHPHNVSFSGHSHTTEHHMLGREHGYDGTTPHRHHVLTAACGSWWSGPPDHAGIPCADSRDGTPKGFHMLSVDGSRHTTSFVSATDRATSQMRVMLDRAATRSSRPGAGPAGFQVSRKALAGTRVLVNLFDGGPQSRVWLEVPGHRRPIELQRSFEHDPFVAELFSAHAASCKPWVTAGVSSHIWAAALPPTLTEGPHAARVRAIGEYGRESSEAMLLEVTV